MSDETNNSVFRGLSSHFRLTGFALLVFIGVLLTIRFNHDTDELDVYIVIISISTVVLLVGSAICLIIDSRNQKKSN